MGKPGKSDPDDLNHGDVTNGREAEVLHAVAQITGSEGDEWMNGWKGVGNATKNCKFVDAIVCVYAFSPQQETKLQNFKLCGDFAHSFSNRF